MTRVLFYIFLTYAAMNLVVALRVRPLLPPGRLWTLILALFCLAMVLAPICTRLLERAGFNTWASFTAWAGYCWMGFAGLAFCTVLISWLLQGLGSLAGWAGLWQPPAALGRWLAALALAVPFLTCIYGVWEASHPRVEHFELTSAKLPAELPRLRIVQVSDVHLGLINGQTALKRIAALVEAQHPDLLISTGDMVDGNLFMEDGLASQWAALEAPLGKYAIVGNHEVYAGLSQSQDFLDRAGFAILRQRWATVAGGVDILGLDDPAVPSSQGEARETALLKGLDPSHYVIVLKHRPDVPADSLGLFDLQLSGHTHGGQIYPFNYVTGAVYPMQDGLYRLAKGSILYTSRGTGTWGPPMRVLAPPVVTVIDIVRRPPQAAAQ